MNLSDRLLFPRLASFISEGALPQGDRRQPKSGPDRREPGTARFFLREAVRAARRLSYRAALYRIDGVAIGCDGALDGGWESAWKYHFLDPQRPGWGALVCVSRGDITFVRGEACDHSPLVLGYWRVDSPQVARYALDSGNLVRMPLAMRLEGTTGRPRWWVGSPTNPKSLSMDAASGEAIIREGA